MARARTPSVLAVLLLAGFLALAGCGGDSDDAAVSTVSNEFICDQSMADFDMVGPPPMGPDIMSQACANLPGRGLARAEWVAQGNRICAEAEATRNALGAPRSPAEVAALAQVADNELAQFRALRALDPPEDLLSGADRAIELLDRTSEFARTASQAAAVGETATVTELLAQIEVVRPELDAVAADLGLSACVD